MKSIIDNIEDIGARLRELEGKPLESKFKCQRCRDTGRVEEVPSVWGPCPDCTDATPGIDKVDSICRPRRGKG